MGLKEIRQARQLTVEQMAFLGRVDKSTISRAERGLQVLSPETIVRISQVLKVSPSRLTGKTGDD